MCQNSKPSLLVWGGCKIENVYINVYVTPSPLTKIRKHMLKAPNSC
jgi:hypothetical protein